MAESSDCDDVDKIFEAPDSEADKKYRYFNQPIGQIPGYEEDKPQILAHRPNCGLQWITLDKCLPVVTCLKLESEELVIERRSIVIIKDFEIDDNEECPNIEVTECEEEEEL
jgi:hypothetical protein